VKPLFADRAQAGNVLARALVRYARQPETVVLALPRGGVPVGYQVAVALELPLDVFVVRKLGLPGHEELAMGAIASGGVIVVNDEVVRSAGVPPAEIAAVAEREGRELARRERLYQGGRPAYPVAGATVLLIDDGLATGSSMSAAVVALRRSGPARIVVAVPTAAAETCARLHELADEAVCATTPHPFSAVGAAYRVFDQTSDEEVAELLALASARRPGPAAPR
jgi:predicted phosphoribosyltransferase